MRIQVFSDFHFDHTPGIEPRLAHGVDAVVVAGDVCQGLERGSAWLRRFVPAAVPLVLVPGNHEFYGHMRGEERRRGEAAAAAHAIHLLDDRALAIGGVRFVGSTLWTDYDLFGVGTRGDAMAFAARCMNDHRLIQEEPGDDGRFTPAHARAQHLVSRAFLEHVLAEPYAGPTVVVTHHCPHPDSVAPQYAGDLLTPAFCSDLSALIARAEPALWVHGHTHVSFDYRVGATRILCNPHGYGHENPAFDPQLVVEV